MRRYTILLILSCIFFAQQGLSQTVINEGFEGAWPPTGWTIDSWQKDGTEIEDVTWKQQTTWPDGNGPTSAFEGSKSAVMQFSGGGRPLYANFNITTPNFDVSSFNNPQVSFKWYYVNTTSEASYFEMQGSTDNGETFETFSTVMFVTGYETKDWMDYTQVFDRNYTNIRIAAYKASGGTYRSFHIDNFIVEEGPEVAPPVNITTRTFLGEEGKLDIIWGKVNDQSMWNLKIANEEIDPDVDNALIYERNLRSSEYVASDLAPNHAYHVYIQTVDGPKTSEWIHSEVFLAYAPVTLPLDIDFEEDDGKFVFVQDGQVNQWYWGSATASEGIKSMYISNDGGATNAYDNLSNKSFLYKDIIFPDSMPDGAVLFFDHKGIGNAPNQAMQIWIVKGLNRVPVAGSFFYASSLGTFSGDSVWTSYEIPISNVSENDTCRLIIGWKDDNTTTTIPSAFDNFRIDAANIVAPTSPKVIETTTSTATIDWFMTGSANAWEIEYGPLGFEVGEGTVVQSPNIPPFTITGLEDASNYQFVVRSKRIDDTDTIVSSSSEPEIFVTQALPKSAPYSYNFDDVPAELFDLHARKIPSGWLCYSEPTESNEDAPLVKWYLLEHSYFTESDPNAAAMLNPSGKENIMIITPELVGISSGKNRISFYSCINHPGQWMTVGVMSDPTDISTFVELERYDGIDQIVVDYDSESFRGGVIRNIVYFDSDLVTAEHKHIAFKAGDIMQRHVTIDNFVYEPIPDVLEPDDLRIIDVSTNNAKIAWVPMSGETKWEVINAVGNVHPSADTVGIVVENEPTFTFDDLTPGTYYEAYVRGIDANGVKSPWSTRVFYMTCTTKEMPYIENFESITLTDYVPQCWTVDGYISNWLLVSNSEEANSGALTVEFLTTTESFESGDWLFTPDFPAEKDKVYEYTFWVKSKDINNTLSVYFGLGSTVEDMGEALATITKFDGNYNIVKVRVTAPATGSYNFGVKYAGTSSVGLFLDDAVIREIFESHVEEGKTSIVYPTVVTSSFNVELSDATETAFVQVYDSQGRVVYETTCKSGDSVPVSSLSDGMYFVKVRVGLSIETKKIIIRK
ncbi:MAG: T9SS type A sorting domain-containing protein [Mangrovibacterium sp.]